jgi:hypothetical protein
VAGVAYGPRPQPGTKAIVEAWKKRKADAYGYFKRTKCAKVPAKKKGGL